MRGRTVDNIGDATNIGGLFSASDGKINWGVRGFADSYNAGGTENIGVWGKADGADWGTQIDIGVRGTVVDTNNGPSLGDWAGYFEGDVWAATKFLWGSDSTLKTNIMPLNSILNSLRQIDVFEYQYKPEYKYLGFDNSMHFGVIAQDIENISPYINNLVENKLLASYTDTSGAILMQPLSIKTVNYIEFIPLLIKGINELSDSLNNATTELQNQINNLQNQIILMQQALNECCKTTGSLNDKYNPGTNDISPTQSITLENCMSIVLNQNEPNPFAEQTTIRYQIPNSVISAVIYFTDNTGNIIKVVDIPERGNGQIIVYAQNLSSGVYYYYLVADGVTIETKKMIYTK